MTEYTPRTKPTQFRLPLWVAEYLEDRAAAMNTTKTEVVIAAVTCLQARETEECMRAGYEEMSARGLKAAENGLAGSAEVPEW